MGGCESCASPRRREAAYRLQETTFTAVNADQLREAIQAAEVYGIIDSKARQRYAELAASERESAGNVHQMLEWATAMQDGVTLAAVIDKCSGMSPVDHDADIRRAKLKLIALQRESKRKMHAYIDRKDARGLAKELDKAKRMRVSPESLTWEEKRLRTLLQQEEAEMARLAMERNATASPSHEQQQQQQQQPPESKDKDEQQQEEKKAEKKEDNTVDNKEPPPASKE